MEVLLDEKTIADKITELAALISKDYAGRELVLISILTGAAIFTADLMRRLTISVAVEFIQAASYGVSTASSKIVTIKQNGTANFHEKHVLIIDTIIDSGRTMETLLTKISAMGPASLGTVALLDKTSRRIANIVVTYRGFEIPNKFVVGYGMDFAGHYRNLPYVAALAPHDSE
jgi:hypoxanthine phosphoribosyltransferase